MRSLTAFLVLLVGFMAPGSRAHAQGTEPASKTEGSTSVSATKEEVNQLRSEVAAQRQTIEELKALVQQLANQPARDAATPVAADSQAAGGVHLMNAALVESAEQAAKPAAKDQKPAEKKPETPVVAGWNGEHFFIKSGDGEFQIQPYGYFQSDYRAYKGDGAPSDTFLIRRARFGFQGNYGTHHDYAVLIDAAAGNGITLRDLYINMKPTPAFQFQVGQFKEPFAQETLTGATNLDFVERSLAALLYPSAATAYRSPGATIHGDLNGGIVQYWLGAFNGKGILTNNTTNEPEIIGRLRFYPWKKKKDNLFQGFAFGGSIGRGRSRGLSAEQSFAGTLPDAAFNFFPSFRINGPVERYNGEITWVHGPWAVRTEYDQLNQFRRAVGSETSDGLGFVTLPGVVAKAGYVQATYLLTGEARPENGAPKVKRPFMGLEGTAGGHGWGAWELAFRYDKIQAKEPGISIPNTGHFLVSNGNATPDLTVGTIDEIDPGIGTTHGPIVVNSFVMPSCMPTSIVQGPGNNFLVGCADHDGEAFPPNEYVIDGTSGKILATITNVGGVDETWFNPGDNRYYLAARDMPTGPVMGVIDTRTNKWLVNVPTGSNSHSIAADPNTNHIFVPLQAGSRCTTQSANGCVAVYAQQ